MTAAESASAKSASTGLTGLLPDVSGIKARLDALEAERDAARAEAQQLRTDLEAAHKARDEAQGRAERLAKAVDSGEVVEREPGDFRDGDLVTWRHVDVVTGDELSGLGVVAHAGEGGLTVAPVSTLVLTLPLEQVAAIPAATFEDDEDDEDA